MAKLTKLQSQMDVRAKTSGFTSDESNAYHYISGAWFGPDSGWGTRKELIARMQAAHNLKLDQAVRVFGIWQEACEVGLIKDTK